MKQVSDISTTKINPLTAGNRKNNRGPFFAPPLQPKLTINQPNDAYEQEADAMADRVMRMPANENKTAFFHPAPVSSPGIHRKCAACEEEKKDIRRKDAVGTVTPVATPAVYQTLQSGGQPMDRDTRSFMEQRFGCDFGSVQIHNDILAHQSSEDISAKAYTTGQHIVFGAGQYQPTTYSGKQLLAHELTHVVQQNTGLVNGQFVQRDKIPYRQLIITDFLATPPRSSPYSAEIKSGFDIPGTGGSPDYKNTKKKCTIDGKQSTTFEAEIKIDPAQFDALSPYMDQNQSWIKDRFKDNGVGYCLDQAKHCERDFDQSIKDDEAICKGKVTECETAFKTDSMYRYGIGNEVVVANKKSECGFSFFDRCKDLYTKNRKISLGTITARTKADCTRSFQSQCQVSESATIKLLIKHEQGHFDITKVMADMARSSLKARTSAKLTAKACSKEKVEELIMALSDEIQQLGKDWQTAKDKAQQDYDTQTQRGSDASKQGIWEKKIKDGLKEYDLAAPALPAPSAIPQKPNPAPTERKQD
ncbi:MAG TPA: DUF4157 domain-containing protein [Puia sp.]|nr:DUF4157 domain-containing protein [Puia sp.]